MTTGPALTAQLLALGVRPGGVLLLHTSFRAVRPVEGGPEGLIHAVRDALGASGTLVMPSWGDDDDVPFDPASTPVAADLGTVAQIFARLPGVRRSDHPFAFAALGPEAHRIIADPLPIPPHGAASPVGRVHDLDGQILLLGVGHDANTTIHLAEALAKVPYGTPKHCTVLRDGRPMRIDYIENDCCTERFAFVDAWLGAQRTRMVGNAHARLIRSHDVVETVRQHLARDPLVFLHPENAGCAECDEARATVEVRRP